MKKTAILTIILSVLIGILPIISVLIAALTATIFGCIIDESGTSMCPTVFGDIGGLLSMMGVFGWFIFYSVPAGIAGVVVGVILLIVSALRTKKQPQTPLQKD